MELKFASILAQLLIIAHIAQAQNGGSLDIPISIQGYKLNGFNYKVFHSVTSLSCAQRCLSEFPKCVSYNHLSSKGEFVCELNSKGIGSMAEGLADILDKEPDSVFVQIQSSSMNYPSTCADQYKSGSRVSGIYYIRDDNDNYYRVYCDFHSESRKVYTLIDSGSFRNRGLPQFRNQPFYLNDPLKEDDPNWEYYRLSLARMKYISSRSTHWRITCNFPQDGLKYVDYVRGRISDVDFLTFKGSNVCKKVEYINVIGHACSECTVAWWQEPNSFIFHHDTTYASCNFGITADSVPSQDVFGFYAAPNPKFRCCSSDTSNTNVWLGSNV